MYTPAVPAEFLAYRQYSIGTFTVDSASGTFCLGCASTAASAAWPLANVAIYVPFWVNETLTVYEAGVGTGATAGGNFDIGIYNAAGTRLVSSGSTARTASAWNVAGLTDTELQPGQYYAAMSADGTNNYSGFAAAAGLCEALGLCEQTTAFALPATATMSRTTRALIPSITFSVRSVAL